MNQEEFKDKLQHLLQTNHICATAPTKEAGQGFALGVKTIKDELRLMLSEMDGTLTVITPVFLAGIPSGDVFATGQIIDSSKGVNMAATGQMLRWVAVKGGADDWAIYVSPINCSVEHVKAFGDKVQHEYNIRVLVNCDDAALALYRR